MPYEVIAPEVNVLKALSEYKDEDGKVIGYDSASVLRFQGEVVADEDVHPAVRKAYEDGDSHVTSILKQVDGDVEPEDTRDDGLDPDASVQPAKEGEGFGDLPVIQEAAELIAADPETGEPLADADTESASAAPAHSSEQGDDGRGDAGDGGEAAKEAEEAAGQKPAASKGKAKDE
jgi:hypothetical protein